LNANLELTEELFGLACLMQLVVVVKNEPLDASIYCVFGERDS
jgi:hypothetical protein